MKKDFVSLAEARPDLAKEWNYEKNGGLKPDDVSCGSNKKVWWKLPYDVPDDYPVEHLRGKYFEFEWQANINNRARGAGCPYLYGRAVWKGFNDLYTVNPELTKQWHPAKTGDLKPTQVTVNSHQKVWWLYPYDDPNTGKHFDFEWNTTIDSRKKYHECPFLSGRAILEGFNDLQTTNPELAAEWHPSKNGSLKPTQVTVNSHQKVWWLLSYDVPKDYSIECLRGKHFDFEWLAMISQRNNGRGCPYLTGKAIWPGFNDLATINPELAAEWHPSKNGSLKPTQVTATSHQKVWWLYPYDDQDTGRHFDFEWMAVIGNRNRGANCPYLYGRAVWKGFNDLQTVNPYLAAQWHPTKNGDLKPTQVTINSAKKVWWLLQYDVPTDYPVKHLRGKHFDFEWQATINSRINNGCPVLSGQTIWKGFNDLQTVNQELAAEWHPTKNGDLKPTQVTANTDKKVWWLLSYDVPKDYSIEYLRGKHFNFEWKAAISDRNSRNRNCPFLSGNSVWKGFNDLQTINPTLAKQWHPSKNGKLTPTQITAHSGLKVWWLLPYNDKVTGKHFDFEWMADINSRSKGAGCPYLTAYKGEEYIKQYLQKNNISFNIQQKFSDLFGTGDGQLSYDFSIPDEKYRHILIEYNGIQHYETVDYFGGEEQFKKQKEHDKRKRDYAKKHGYKLITVKYTYDTYESVEEYLDNELKKLGVINSTKKEESVNDAA